jgi:hypothetical protein
LVFDNGIFLPLLGFLFLPFTTLIYIFAVNPLTGQISAFGWIWLILALTPIASAIYGSRRNTLMKAAVVSALLVGIQAARPDRTWLAWGEQAAHISFIVLISLLVNRLASLISPQPTTASI